MRAASRGRSYEPGHEAVERIGPQAVLLAHFELGPESDLSEYEVLLALGALFGLYGIDP